ncbi:MAG TPA: amidohydrolase [Stellaceae bacterium]|nr:amidohydrolase [Stellaceae bacterium]
MLPKADLVLRNGRVWGGLAEGVTEAVALWSGRVLATGTDGEIESLIGPSTTVVDLRGRLATPGLNDAHMHLLPLGIVMAEVDVRPAAAPTLDALLAKIKAAADRQGPGQWVLARGYDHFKLDTGRHPTRDELDAVAPGNPVYVVRTCGHLAVANSLALRLAGIDERSAAPQGGAIEQRDGRLTGLLAENARDPLTSILPALTEAQLVDAIERAGKLCLGFGITSVMDAAVGIRAGYPELPAYQRAKRDGRLPVRTYQCLLGGPGGIVEEAYANGLLTGTGDDRLMLGPVKIFTDGSAGGRTAAMSESYLGDTPEHGILCLKPAELNDYVLDYHLKGYQMAIHAIGDTAIQQTLDAYERAFAAEPAPNRRHRIEHCGFLSDAQIDRMVALGVQPAPQPVFMVDFGDLYVSVVGEERAAAAYPMRRWLNAGLFPAASSDAPVCDINPFPNLYGMITRRTGKGTLLGGQERIRLDEALSAMTYNGTYVAHAERVKGRLVPGQLADIAVFSRDLFDASPDEIHHDTACDLTILGGEIVHDRLAGSGR